MTSTTPPGADARNPLLLAVHRWIDSWAGAQDGGEVTQRTGIDWLRVIPFTLVHVACIAVIWVGWSPAAVIFAAILYVVRMFSITAFYHRYFSHRAFKTSRFAQFCFAVLGNSAVQRGPLWWAAHHREHHGAADTTSDPHSPMMRGFWWSHLGWILDRSNFRTRIERVRDLAKFPELCFLDRYDTLVPLLLFGAAFGLGAALEAWAPGLETSGMQFLVWSLISTVVLAHATFTINSVAHLLGSRRFETKDTSRNNFVLALLTLGEGWHNNHHHYQAAARQGFYWWEIDFSYMGLRVLNALGIVWEMNAVPVRVMESRRRIRRPE